MHDILIILLSLPANKQLLLLLLWVSNGFLNKKKVTKIIYLPFFSCCCFFFPLKMWQKMNYAASTPLANFEYKIMNLCEQRTAVEITAGVILTLMTFIWFKQVYGSYMGQTCLISKRRRAEAMAIRKSHWENPNQSKIYYTILIDDDNCAGSFNAALCITPHTIFAILHSTLTDDHLIFKIIDRAADILSANRWIVLFIYIFLYVSFNH